MKPATVVLIVMIALALLAAPAGATMSYYSDQAAWAAATSNVFTIDFNDVAVPPEGFIDYSTTGVQLHSVTFTANPATAEGIMVGNLASICAANAFGAGNYFLCGNTYGAKYFEAALPGNVIAVAMNLLPFAYANPVTLTFSSGDTQVIPALPNATPVFAGFVFDQPISSVKFEATSIATGIDNFAYSQIEETPEASTLLLAGAGLISLLFAKRLRRYC